jgi:hypothetical protein
MPESMVCRIDPLPIALFSNSYGIINVLRKEEFVFARLIRTEQLPGGSREDLTWWKRLWE